jgi:hypothetical protein
MDFPAQPKELQVTELEERLVSPVNVFLQLRELPRGGQASVHGNAVNVPADNITTVKLLPKRTEDSATIPVKLKRRLRYKSHFLFQNVRPAKCVEATKYLLQNSDLYKLYVPSGFDDNWINHIQSETASADSTSTELHSASESNQGAHTTSSAPSSSNVPEIVIDSPSTTSDQSTQQRDVPEADTEEDTWTEVDPDANANLPAGHADTMFNSFHYNDDGQHILSCAPSEYNQPISILNDDIEELAYPTIFCGQRRPSHRRVRVSYGDICKSELRNKDRRAARSISNIFFKTKKLQMKQIKDKIWVCLRRIKTKGKSYTAGDFNNDDTIKQMVKLDEGYKIFRSVRGSPAYWETAKKDVFGMVRQLGLPTFFISLSAADTRWPDLLIALSKIVDDEVITEEDVREMTWEAKCRLIRSDPVTVSRFFDHRVSRFITDFLQSSLHPLGELMDYFYRVEFQQRGSPPPHPWCFMDIRCTQSQSRRHRTYRRRRIH